MMRLGAVTGDAVDAPGRSVAVATQRRAPLSRRGTSMAEVMLSTLLVGVLLLAALEVVGSSVRGVRVASEQIDAQMLADELMAEILAVAYSDPDATAQVVFGIESNEPGSPVNRVAFDDVDDYDGWQEQDLFASRDAQRQISLPGWVRRVAVEHVDWINPTRITNDSDDGGIKRIAVEVIDPEGQHTYSYALRAAGGALQQSLGVDLEVIAEVSVAIEVDGEHFAASANLRNHASGP